MKSLAPEAWSSRVASIAAGYAFAPSCRTPYWSRSHTFLPSSSNERTPRSILGVSGRGEDPPEDAAFAARWRRWTG